MRAAVGFTFRAVLSKPLPEPDPLFEQWGNDTLYPPPNPSEEPNVDVSLQCGVKCSDQQVCHHTKGKGTFCEFHEKIASESTKEYHKNVGVHERLNSGNAMRIIPLRIRVYLMYRNAQNHRKESLTNEEKSSLEGIGQGHLSYITSNLLPHWDTATYGTKPESADTLVTSFLKWTPKVGELVRAKYRPESNRWKLAHVMKVAGNTVEVQFKGYSDLKELEMAYVKPSYFAMPPKTVFVQYVLDNRPCVMLLKGSGLLRDMEWSCLPDQPIWDLLAIIFNGTHIMFTNIVSKKPTLQGKVVIPLPSSEPKRPGEKIEMSVWYTVELLKTAHFAEYMNDEFSEVLSLYDASEKKERFSIDVNNVFNTTGTVTSAITDMVVNYHAKMSMEDQRIRAAAAGMYLKKSKKHLVSFTLWAPIKIPQDSVVREMVEIYMQMDAKKIREKIAELLSTAFQTRVTVDQLEEYSNLVYKSRIVRKAMNESDMSWLDKPELAKDTIDVLKDALGKHVLLSQFPKSVQKLLQNRA